MDSVACKAVYYTVGNVRVTVKQGDITKEDTDAIVNSSNKDLDMSQGGVAQAIRKAGGQELDTELKRLRQTMKNEQIVVSEAKGLGCKNIIHITAVEMSTVNYIDKWNSVIIRCLQEADKCLFTSIALPALGTGLGMTAAASADMIMKAIVEYQGNIQHHVTDIRVVVYQSSMTEEYQKAAKYATCRNKLTDSDGSVPGNVVDKTQRSVILGAETSALQLKEDVVDPDKVTLAIIALHPGDIDRITRKLTKRFKEKQKVKKIKEDIIKKMHGKQMEEINDIAKRYHLHFEAETAKGKIKISGYHEHVSEALEEIQRVINAAKMDQHSTTYVELLKKPVQWYFVENGEMKEFDKETNLYIEAARTNQKLQFIF
ncbi:protein mono-ADP-ribosyltransferase PARP14-like, partial [Mercenaria mercenaria]|uniref:protein mono-ADP-ribosyltransferase PARP14-like n=1 Tax=Mercenaria mercenaria TaxID=6596 RepID=UPI00234EC808